jgi:hypothetical protein
VCASRELFERLRSTICESAHSASNGEIGDRIDGLLLANRWQLLSGNPVRSYVGENNLIITVNRSD